MRSQVHVTPLLTAEDVINSEVINAVHDELRTSKQAREEVRTGIDGLVAVACQTREECLLGVSRLVWICVQSYECVLKERKKEKKYMG